MSGGEILFSKIYLNNGTSLVENQTWQQNLTAVRQSSLALVDIDNDGDLDLVLAGGSSCLANGCSTSTSKIYLNNGTSFIENQTWQQNLTAVHKSSIAMGDIDNDGRLDLVLTGCNSTSSAILSDCDGVARSKIYLNNGTSFIENQTWQQNLTQVFESSIAFADIDDDGDLDLSLTGHKINLNKYAKIYLNNGTSFTENQIWQQNLVSVGLSSLAFGDYDNDNKLDLIIMGFTDSLNLYKNNGTSFVLNQTHVNAGGDAFGGIYAGSLAFGDYDTDGDLDLSAMGNEQYTDAYNNNNTLFYNDVTASSTLTDLQQGTVTFSDVDNDTDLDLILTGGTSGGAYFSKVYLNNQSLTRNNTLPKHPNSTDFSASYANNQLALRWGNGSDNETPINGLYYNLRVGTASGGNQIVSGIYGGSSNPTAGYFGNMMQRKSITLHGSWLQANTTYYWSVQTIDTGLAKSNWSVEQTFSTAADITYPTITINFPDDSNYTSFSNITFNATVSDNVNISNVSLYGTWGNWHRNQTNSSGINGTSYIFQANLSAYGEGTYTWAIRSCDTTNNCIFSANRTVVRDLIAPLIYLESPANASSWTDNNSVTFSFNVTDFAIQNCSLIVGSSLKYNFTSVSINTSTSATVTLSNGNYNWSVNCTDNLLRQNKSETRQLTVNYQAPSTSSSSGGGGGGGGGVSYSTYSLGELKETQERNKELGKGDKIKFSLKGEEHNLTIKKVTSENATIEINSTAFNFTLAVNESRKFNLSNAEFYDLFVRLNNIKYFKANLTLMAIHEEIYVKPVENITQEEEPAENIAEEIKEKLVAKEEKEREKPRNYLLLLGILLLIFVSTIIIWIKRNVKKLGGQ